MTQFAADDFAYIAAKCREIAGQHAAARTTMTDCKHCHFAFHYHAAPALRCPNCGSLDPLDMDAANEPADLTKPIRVADTTGLYRIVCENFGCKNVWDSETPIAHCPKCGRVYDPDIPF